MPSCLAVIPARGGSKRLPRKNIADLGGKPVIGYTIEAALNSGRFNRVAVSTEDSEIADVASRFGAVIADRDPALAGDNARVDEVCLDLLTREEHEGRHYDRICCLYATAPMRGAEDIAATLDLIDPPDCEFAMAVTRFDMPVHQALLMDGQGYLEPKFPDLVMKRSTEVDALFIDNGSTYAATVSAFRSEGTFRGPNARGYLMPRDRSIDLDEPEDLVILRALAETR